MPSLPSGVYAIVDGSASRPPLDLVSAFVRGGAVVVQLRLKEVGAGELLRVAREARKLCDAAQGADYIGFGPIFPTASKAGRPLPPPQGIDGLRRAVRRSRIPVVAIGGITVERAPDAADAGARCVAAIAQLCGAPDPEAATRDLAKAFAR